MDWKTTLTRTMRSATSDKEDLNRRILQWHRRLKEDRKSTRLNSSHGSESRMPSSA